jgi:hypothetical protein
MKRVTVDVTTHVSDGTATAYSGHTRGQIHSITCLKDGATPFADGVDFTITLEDTGESIWAQSDVNASVTKYPRVGVHDAVGVAATTDGTRLLRDKVALSSDRIKIVIAQGGNSKLGRFIFTLDDE